MLLRLKRILDTLLRLLGIIALVGIVVFAILTFGIRASDEYEVILKGESPDGEYIATFYSNMGGGAAGWCRLHVSVTHASYPLRITDRRGALSHEVFSASCNSEINLQWVSDRELRIKYTGIDSPLGIRVHMKSHNSDNKIKIKYDST